MGFRVMPGALLCVVLVLLLCGCESEHLVYKAGLEDTWYAVNSAVRQSVGCSACYLDEKKHVLRTCEYSCGWEHDSAYSRDGVFSRKDYQYRRTYWYAEIECREMDEGTEVRVSVKQRVEYYPAKADNSKPDYTKPDYEPVGCLKAAQWRDKFFRELDEKLGEPKKVRK